MPATCTVDTYEALVSEVSVSCQNITIAANIIGAPVTIGYDVTIAGSEAFVIPPLHLEAARVTLQNVIIRGGDNEDGLSSDCNPVIDVALEGIPDAGTGLALGAPGLCVVGGAEVTLVGVFADTGLAAGVVLQGKGSSLVVTPPSVDFPGLVSEDGRWPLIIADADTVIDATRLDVEGDPTGSTPPAQIIAYGASTRLVDAHFDIGGRAIYADDGLLEVRGTGSMDSPTARFTDLHTPLGGAAIVVNNGTDVTISQVLFQNLSSQADGGAILAFGAGGTLAIDGSHFADCYAEGMGGAVMSQATGLKLDSQYNQFGFGGAASGGAIAMTSRGSFDDVGSRWHDLIVPDGTGEAALFSGMGRGGAIYLDNATHVRVEGAYFDNNAAEGGGAIWVQDPLIPSPDGRDVSISQSHFGGNRARWAGGAVWVGAVGVTATDIGTEVVGCNFVHNRTDEICTRCFGEGGWWDGGGAAWFGGLGAVVEGSLFCANGSPVRGGAIRVGTRAAQRNVPHFVVTNSGFYQNAAFVGAAIKNHAGVGALEGADLQDDTLLVRNVSFAANGTGATASSADFANGSTIMTPVSGFVLENNLLYDALWGVQFDPNATTATSRRNSAYGTTTFQARPHGEVLVLPAPLDYTDGELPFADPAFVSYPSGQAFPTFSADLDAIPCGALDFHLSSGSPARDAGQDSAGRPIDLGMFGGVDMDADGIAQGPDCDDYDAATYPGAAEIAENGIDEDCDGADATGGPDTDDTDGTDATVAPWWYGGRSCASVGAPWWLGAAAALLLVRRRR